MPHNHGLAPWSGNFYPSAHSIPLDIVTMKNNTVDRPMGMWGIVLKPTLRYKMIFDRPFHLKQAVLDSNGFIKQDFHFRVMLVDNKDDPSPITLCIMDKQTLNATLDLEFEQGDDVTFYVKTDLYNMDLNSFSVSLSGKSTRTDDDTFGNRPSALPPMKTTELIQKGRSSSLPDEYYHQKKNLPSPLAKTAPPDGSSTWDDSAKSPSAVLLRAESTHEETTNPTNSESRKSTKRSNSYKGSFRGGDVFGKLGKYLSKS